MYANDENRSTPSKRKGKRRSSILKNPKSPGGALDDIDPNTENAEETDQRSKKARRSSSRRVSFAEKCQVKEIPKVPEMMDHVDFAINGANAVPPSFLNLESTGDNSMYRQPAQTLVGLTALLTSPIQESPQRSEFPQFPADDGDNELDMTCCQPIGNGQNQSLQAMDMTTNYEGWELEQSTVLSSKFSVANKKDDGQLDFTRSHGANILDNEHNMTRPQDVMEMTGNYGGWEIEQSTVLTRQIVTSKVEISNHGEMPKLNASKFLEDLKANDSRSNESFERRNSYDQFPTSRNAQSPMRDGASFLNQLNTSSNHGSNTEQQQRRDILNNPTHSRTQSTTRPVVNAFPRARPCPGLSPKRNGSSFLRQLEATSNVMASCQPQVTDPAPPSNPQHTMMRSPEKNDELEFTRCRGGYFERFDDDEEVTENQMEMTRNYAENWENHQSYMVPLKRDGGHDKHSGEEDLEFTRCIGGNIESSRFQTVDEDITVNMEMTRNYENWEQEKPMNGSQTHWNTSRNNNNLQFKTKPSPKKEQDLELTRCQAGRIETSSSGTPNHLAGADEMEMTRSYENWEKSITLPPQSKTPRNENDLHVASKVEQLSPEQGDILDFTRCQDGNIETSELPVFDEDVTAGQMEITRNCEDWQERNTISTEAKTPRNLSNCVQKVSRFSPNRLEQILERSEVTVPELQRSISTVNNSRREKPRRHEESLMNVSRQRSENQRSQSRMKKIESHEETPIPKMNTRRREKEHEKSMVTTSRSLEVPAITTSSVASRDSLEISADEASIVKAVPRATSSKITMDKNFKRFEIKMPTSRIPVAKPEEKQVKLEEKPMEKPVVSGEKEKPGTSCDQDMAESITSAPLMSHVDNVENEAKLEIEASLTPKQDIAHSETEMNMSSKSSECEAHETTTTATKSEPMEVQLDCKPDVIRETIPHEQYTLKQFILDADINFGAKMIKRRSETPMILAYDTPKELKDKIYSKCLSEAKHQIMEDFAQQLQKDIAENEKLSAAKEKELDTNNPPVFTKLKQVLGTENEDSVVNILKKLKKTSVTRSKRLWYTRKKEMRKNILAALQEQEKKLLSDVSTISQLKNDLDEDIVMLNKAETDLDKQLQELDASLESDEKEWAEHVKVTAEYVKVTAELQQKLESLELGLKAKEEQRTNLSSSTESLSREIAKQKEKTTDIENAVEKLVEEKKLRESKGEEMRKFLPIQTALQEWILEKYDKTQFKFTFLGKTLDLEISFEDEEKIKNIQLSSQISAISTPLAMLGHQLVMEKFAPYDYLTLFPTRKKLPQLLHQVSLACCRVRILLEAISEFSINHIVSVNDKVLTVEFSSLAKFLKFVLNFDLSKLVTDGDIPFTVVRKIGTTSAEAISEELNKLPSTVVYLLKILKCADQMLK